MSLLGWIAAHLWGPSPPDPARIAVDFTPSRTPMKVGLSLGIPASTDPYAGTTVLHYRENGAGAAGAEVKVDVTKGPVKVEFDGGSSVDVAGEYVNKFGVSQGVGTFRTFKVANYTPTIASPDPATITVDFVDEIPDADAPADAATGGGADPAAVVVAANP